MKSPRVLFVLPLPRALADNPSALLRTYSNFKNADSAFLSFNAELLLCHGAWHIG